MARYTSVLNQRGQVTLPLEVRRELGLNPTDEVVFDIADGAVRLLPSHLSLEQLASSVPPLNPRRSEEEIEELIQLDRDAKAVRDIHDH